MLPNYSCVSNIIFLDDSKTTIRLYRHITCGSSIGKNLQDGGNTLEASNAGVPGSSWTLHRSKRLLLHANVQRSCRIECLIGISSCDDQENKCITLSPNIFGKIHYDIFPNRSYNKYLPCGATRIKVMVKSHCPSRIIRLHQLEITHHSFEVTFRRKILIEYKHKNILVLYPNFDNC